VRTLDHRTIRASPAAVHAVASAVEAWPSLLSHYRRVRVLERRPDGSSVVEMAAVRPFGIAGWPVWWVSEMRTDTEAHTVTYRHVRGITSGMDVEWRMVQGRDGTDVTIEHRWPGPRWPVIGGPAAELVIGPLFIHGIASRTLAGLAAVVESTP
jgi:ribosome-associated toxin RatA of RatAB toxin-antitoxin module